MVKAYIGKNAAGASVLSVLVLAIGSGACQSELNPRHPKPVVIVWQPVGTWSGRGSTQTDSFDMNISQWRVKWKAANETAPGKGQFTLTVNSAISGRPLSELVRRDGPGEGIAYVTDDPRLYHLVIDSHDLDWTVSVEQPISTGGPDSP